MDESEQNEVEAISEDSVDWSEETRTLKRVKQELARCEAERKQYLEGWQRAKADIINYRNDETKRSSENVEYLRREMLSGLVPILDSFHLALGSDMLKAAERGVTLIYSQLEDALKRLGLKEIPVQAGDQFNPHIHESIGEVESALAVGSVTEILQKGFGIGEYVLRPARVKIAKKKAD